MGLGRSNPEFLKEGDAVNDFLKPDARDRRRRRPDRWRLRRRCTRGSTPRSCSVTARSAELTKYASNAFLATQISFINEIANACEQLGADIEGVADGMGMDSRIGPNFLFRASALAAAASRKTWAR